MHNLRQPNREHSPKHRNLKLNPKHHKLEHNLKHRNLEHNLKHHSLELSQERPLLVLGPLQLLQHNKHLVVERQQLRLVLLQGVQEHPRLQDRHHQQEPLQQPLLFHLSRQHLGVLQLPEHVVLLLNQCWI